MTGMSGAGKSTLAALLMARGWRLMGDEFALLDPATGLIHGFPRLISLKNEAIGGDGARPAERTFRPGARGHAQGHDPPSRARCPRDRGDGRTRRAPADPVPELSASRPPSAKCCRARPSSA
jgi:hypothetical protein